MTGMRMVVCVVGACVVMASCPAVRAGDAAKPAWQWSELPGVVFFEGFENANAVTGKGKIENNPCAKPEPILGKSVLRLPEEKEGDSKIAKVQFEFPNKSPEGVAKELWIVFRYYVETIGERQLTVRIQDGGFEEKIAVAKEKTWDEVMVPVKNCTADKRMPSGKESFRAVEIFYKSKDKNKAPTVFVDNVLVCTSAGKPAGMVQGAMRVYMKTSALAKAFDKDGFQFNSAMQEAMKASIKAHRPPSPVTKKTVLVVGPRPTDTDKLLAKLEAEKAKEKSDLKFVAAALPDGKPAGGFSDMRTLLNYNLSKNKPEVALLILSHWDKVQSTNTVDQVRVVLERTLELGCMPLVCLPKCGDEKTKNNTFAGKVADLCEKLGVTMLDADSLLAAKGVKDGMKDNEFNDKGLATLAEVSMDALKHIEAHVLR